MKKIIDGKVYNTETAKSLTTYQYGTSNDLRYYYEELFVTSKGNYFLYGEGGPTSPYAVTCSGSSSGGRDITAFTREEAFAWCQEHNRVSAIEKVFSNMMEEA